MYYLSKRSTAIFLCALTFSIAALWLFSESVSQAAGCATPSFAAVVNTNINNSINALALGDLNGDTKPDLVAANYYNDQLTILTGNGAGNFALSSTVTTGQRPSAVVLADFNQDGKLDLAVARDSSTTVSVLLGTGAATFSAPVNFTVGTNPVALVSADFNNDGKLDLASGNDGSNTISILIGNGSGGFAAATSITNVRPATLVVADFNHDNKADLAAANINNNKVSVVLGDGTGAFSAAAHFDGGSNVHGITAADFNGDTHPDIAVTNMSDCCTPAFVAVLLGNGAGSFTAPTKFSAPFAPFTIATGDFNGDGKADVATANIAQTSSNIAVLLGDGAGVLGSPTTFNVGATPFAVISGDVNLDNVPDLVTTAAPNITALINACGGAPTPTPTATPTPSPTPTPVPTPAQGDVVISQVYAGGGNPGSTYRNNYIELFNRTDRAINVDGWPIYFTSDTGVFNSYIAFVSSRGIAIAPHSYLLIQFGPASTNGAPLSPDLIDDIANQNIPPSGKVFLARPNTNLLGSSCPWPNADIMDFVGYGSTASCFEGTGPTGTTSNTTAALRKGAGCTDSDNNAADFEVGAPSPRNSTAPQNFCGTPPPAVIQFSQASFNTTESSGSIGLLVTRTVNTSGVSTVDYATGDSFVANGCNVVGSSASSRCDYIASIGSLKFAPGETSKLINIPIIDDNYSEVTEHFFVTLSNPTAAVLGTPATANIFIDDNGNTTGNPIDQTFFFVREQYVDFLNREPDNAGLSYWMDDINNCTPKPDCTELKRINVSAAFFLSIEFQETGYLAYRAYKTAYGDATGQAVIQNVPTQISVPIIRLNEFLYDSNLIGDGVAVGTPNWEQQLESNKVAYFASFVLRQRFLTDYPVSMTPTDFVNKLNTNAGNVLSQSERDALVNQLQLGQKTRAEVLRAIAENNILKANESNRAFVLMQYFGYLRRNPNDPQDTDYSGYKFWLDKLNLFNGNFVQADMVEAFITSLEYRNRFGQ